MGFFKKMRAFASLDHASRDLFEVLSEDIELDETEMSYIESHLRLMQLTYENWKHGPMPKSDRLAA